MHVPPWLTMAFAIIVIAFGLYRIRLSLKKVDPEAAAAPGNGRVMGGGFYRMSPRAHLVIGVLYLALGGALVATSFGWSPFGSMFGAKADEPSPPKAPSHPVEVELKK
ncbi:MAG: hypothetical protein ABJE66_38530 [Deltaproteobacteria bacterium]